MKKILLFLFSFFLMQIIIAQSISKQIIEPPIKYEEVDFKPVYPGGFKEFMQFIANNFQNPEIEDLSGVVKVSFVIEKNGEVDDVIILNDLGYGTGKEAKRVLLKCPKWSPGEQNGLPVRVLFELPISIKN